MTFARAATDNINELTRKSVLGQTMQSLLDGTAKGYSLSQDLRNLSIDYQGGQRTPSGRSADATPKNVKPLIPNSEDLENDDYTLAGQFVRGPYHYSKQYYKNFIKGYNR